MKESLQKYFWNLLISIDQWFNTLFAGNPDETISSRMGKQVRDGKCIGCYWICRLIHFIDPNHCTKSIEDDEIS